MERADYREILQDILEFSGGRRLLNITDVCNYLGVSRTTAKKHFVSDSKIGVSAPTLAHKLAQLPAERSR